MSQNVLFIDDNIIKERTSIHDNIDPKLVYPAIKLVQDMYIFPILGSGMYDKIQQIIESSDIKLPAFVQYKSLVDDYIIDALIYYTLSELTISLSYQFWNKGVIRKQGESTDLPSLADLTDISNKYKIRGEWYANRLRVHLIAKAAQLYPEYIFSTIDCETVTPKGRNEACPIYLGDDDGCGCNGGKYFIERI